MIYYSLSGGALRRDDHDAHGPAHAEEEPQGPSKAPKGNGTGATGSKNLPRILELLFFSARHGSKNLGLVLRPLCPYTVALRGVAYRWGGGRTCPYDCMYVCVYIYIYTLYIYIYIYIYYICVHVHTHTHLHIHIHMCVYIYIYILCGPLCPYIVALRSVA